MNKEDEFMKEVRNSLAKQVGEEMGKNTKAQEHRQGQSGKKRKKKKGMNIFLKILIFLIVVLLAGGAFLTLTKPGRKIMTGLAVKYAYWRMEKTNEKPNKPVKEVSGSAIDTEKEEEPELKVGEITDNIDISKMSDTFKNALHEDGVYNILLLGVEAIGSNGVASGRTDSIMIATINTKQKTLGLTSIMRDSYVNIPGYYSTKINAAFGKGGINTVYETIAETYGIRLDGSAVVSFETFQKVIDDLGGVDIEITAGEAQYLNTKNYISKKSNRTLKPGVNHMNGNQALGYARVRYEATLDGSIDDFGRTSRHRRIMGAIFKEVKKSNPITLVKMLDTIFSQIQTDIKKDNASSYLAEVLELSIDGVPLDNLRIPLDGTCHEEKPNGMSVVVFDLPKNKEALTNFIFASHKEPASGSAIKGESATKNK
ncbi:MAG: LCP family protein [Catonella sp.]|uniref:LCP family protein n=1 Tax=Catonella sp. TaxID=2382125 RepID=UPI003FA1441B